MKFGTMAITGLNKATAPHLIGDEELVKSENGWTDQEGDWTTAKGHEVLYTGYSAISCFAAGRMDGEDHLVWMDGDTVYDNGESVGTITAGTTMRIKALNDGFLILGASKPYIYDGIVIRELGAWQGTNSPQAPVGNLDDNYSLGATISSTDSSNPMEVTATAHGFSNGDFVTLKYSGTSYYGAISGFIGPLEISNVTTNTFEVDYDGSYTPFTFDTAYVSSSLDGDYKFYFVPTVRISDGHTIIGDPIGFRLQHDETPNSESDLFEITPSMQWSVRYGLSWSDGATSYFSISGTIGVDYFPGLRLYRTKDSEADLYLVDSWEYGTDASLSGGGFLWANSALRYYSNISDAELGAVYDLDIGDRKNPPAATIGEVVGQRIYLAYEDKVYWSNLDGIEYWNALDFVKFPDTVTALGSVRNKLVIFSSDRMWTLDMSSGSPFVQEIDTPVGSIYPDAMTTVDNGLLFLRTDGLWLFDGATVSNIGRRGFNEISAPKSIVSAGDTIYLSGESDSYVIRVRNGGWIWHESDSPHEVASASGGSIYGADSYSIKKLFVGDSVGGEFKTKVFGVLDETRQYMVRLVVSGPTLPKVWINGTRQEDPVQHVPIESGPISDRRVLRYPIPRLSNSFFQMSVKFTGNGAAHGYEVSSD